MNYTARAAICFISTMATGTLMLGISTAANADPRNSDMIAKLPALVTAAGEACDLDTLRSDPNWHAPNETTFDLFTLGPKKVDDDQADARNKEWLTKYNRFVVSENAKTLRQYAEALGVLKGNEARFSDAECQIVVPAYGVAATAIAIGVKPDDITDSRFTNHCGIGKCVAAELQAVARQCETKFHALRYVEWCRTEKREPITYGETTETRSWNANGF